MEKHLKVFDPQGHEFRDSVEKIAQEYWPDKAFANPTFTIGKIGDLVQRHYEWIQECSTEIPGLYEGARAENGRAYAAGLFELVKLVTFAQEECERRLSPDDTAEITDVVRATLRAVEPLNPGASRTPQVIRKMKVPLRHWQQTHLDASHSYAIGE